MRNAEAVVFGGSGLDRAAHIRGESRKVAALLDDETATVLPVWRGKILVNQGKLIRVCASHPIISQHIGEMVFLGLEDSGAVFAKELSDWNPDLVTQGGFIDETTIQHPDLPTGHVFADLKAVMAQLNTRDAELAASAKSLFAWHRMHRFCSACGVQTTISMAGWQRDCQTCGRNHFPRTDPVVIMLITHGNSVLMGRSPNWPQGMYSLLAGYMEPGETIEAAVRREVYEEAGIRVGDVQYLASQPWAFPSTLMVGCRGVALDEKITVDHVEIEDACWVTREEMLDVYAGIHPSISPARKGSIAHFIIQRWLEDTLD